MVKAVYIHIPFCPQKCNYCDFLSFQQMKEERMAAYVQALCQELRLGAAQYELQPQTIFIGGGTPTCLPLELLQQLLEQVQEILVTPALQEYTVEANPGTLTAEKLNLLRELGVNRLSLGVQSDTVEQLSLLGRIHDYQEVEQSVQMAREAGFTNLNLDLMYGITNQTLEQWQATLQHVLALEPEHISLYQLNIEEGTPLYQRLQKGEIELFDDETAEEMYRAAQQITKQYGYEQYEISNYAREGFASEHNQVYWRTENYLAFGLGACSFISPRRWNNLTHLHEYQQAVFNGQLPQGEEESLTHKERMSETVFMALRMNKGLKEADFKERFGLTLEQAFPEACRKCQQEGWLEKEVGYWRLTEAGRVLGNLVFLEFIE